MLCVWCVLRCISSGSFRYGLAVTSPSPGTRVRRSTLYVGHCRLADFCIAVYWTNSTCPCLHWRFSAKTHLDETGSNVVVVRALHSSAIAPEYVRHFRSQSITVVARLIRSWCGWQQLQHTLHARHPANNIGDTIDIQIYSAIKSHCTVRHIFLVLFFLLLLCVCCIYIYFTQLAIGNSRRPSKTINPSLWLRAVCTLWTL